MEEGEVMAFVGGSLPGEVRADFGEAVRVVGVEMRSLVSGDEAAGDKGRGEVVPVIVKRPVNAEQTKDA
jgi:hypothetical protein